MPKRTQFTNITPLPPQVSREVAIAMLHNHDEMIELNPLVIDHRQIKTPRDAPADEFLDCVWYELTDRVQYLPGGLAKGKVNYRCCFHDIPTGTETHVYAPMGLDIRNRWTVGGTLPGEPSEARELGVDLPKTGLYLREEGDMKCNMMLTSFVRKNLDNSHKVLVERILKKAERIEEHLKTVSPSSSSTNLSARGPAGFQRGSHMSQSNFVNSLRHGSASDSTPSSPKFAQSPDLSVHPAFRNDHSASSSNRDSVYTPPPYQALHNQPNGYPQDIKQNPYLQNLQQPHPQQYRPFSYAEPQPSSSRKEFVAELPGSMPVPVTQKPEDLDRQRESMVSELPASEYTQLRSYPQRLTGDVSDRTSVVSELSRASYYQAYNPQPDSRRISEARNTYIAELPTPAASKSGTPSPSKPSFQEYQAQREKTN